MGQWGRWASLTMRAALILGFSLIFGVWIFAGSYFMNRIQDLEQRTADVNVRYTKAQELLSLVRAQVLLGSVYVRDALMAPPSETTDSRRQLEETYRTVTEALGQYVPVLDSDLERQRLIRLRLQVDEFRATMLQVLATNNARWPVEARQLLRTHVVPKRETVIRFSEEVQALNRAAFVQQQQEMTALYGASQRRLWLILGAGLASSCGIALFVGLYAGRLESSLRRRAARDAQHARELAGLSARLINAQEQERSTIARELHDEVGQVLAAMKVELAVAQRTIESTGGNPQVLGEVRSIAEGALITVRDLSHLLHPSMLDDLGLPSAAESYLASFGKRYGIRTEFRQSGMDERLAPEVEVSCYRIVQEALTNIAKHSRAGSCRVILTRTGNTVQLTIEDDGMGFDSRTLEGIGSRHGLGLIGIRERAVQLGGRVEVTSAAGAGSRILVELPGWLRAAGSLGAGPAGLPTELGVING